MEASGARRASLYVPLAEEYRSEAVLIHEGHAPAAPELDDLARARRLPERTDHGEAPSSDPNARLFRILATEPIRPGREPGRSRRRGDRSTPVGVEAQEPAWLALRFEGQPVTGGSWRPMLRLATALVGHAREISAVLGDALTGLPGRVQFEHTLGSAFRQATRSGEPLSLLLINPDDFGSINERYGPERGDEVLREVGRRVCESLRATDHVARYGGAIFVALLRQADEAGGMRAADKLLETAAVALTLDDSFRLTASAGVASLVPGKEKLRHPSALVRRAEQALKIAKMAGGGCARLWQPPHGEAAAGGLDGLYGFFTGNPSKDYRNMKLLSQAVGAIAASSDFGELASTVADQMRSTLKADYVGVFEGTEEGVPRTIVDPTVRPLQDAPGIRTLIREAIECGRVVERTARSGGEPIRSYAVPLIADATSLGALYLDGKGERLALDGADFEFLEALARQLAMALDRARLSRIEKEWQERERERLRLEIDDLRGSLPPGELVCESTAMKELMGTARRVAFTDATVLVCGESGTGKELIARKIHELSPRKDRPLVVVDCTAIPVTLIESELFGHERGAYTGAQQRKKGRLTEADRGTVFLDEIGELPLEVQGKLLRFVQEKQLCPVGGNRVIEVDARVVAATNRNLEEEVSGGRFREDLFHRLNVIRLDVPPLRARPRDTRALAEIFLRRFSIQYQKGQLRALSPEAEERLVEYPWPGNVRELRNRLMQAVILSRGSEIGPRDLGLGDEVGHTEGGGDISRPALESPSSFDGRDAWESLDAALDNAVRSVLGGDPAALPPLGRWLTDDLVIEAYEASGRVSTRGADLLGIPEATFRRKLRRALKETAAGPTARPGFWDAVLGSLPAVTAEGNVEGDDLLRRAGNSLLRRVLASSASRSVGAALIGVTAPTFRARVRELEQTTEREEPVEARA